MDSVWYLPSQRRKLLLVHKNKLIESSKHRRDNEVMCKSAEYGEELENQRDRGFDLHYEPRSLLGKNKRKYVIHNMEKVAKSKTW